MDPRLQAELLAKVGELQHAIVTGDLDEVSHITYDIQDLRYKRYDNPQDAGLGNIEYAGDQYYEEDDLDLDFEDEV